MKKLQRVEIGVNSMQEFCLVFEAFAAAFPSLEGVDGATLYQWIESGEDAAAEALREQIADSAGHDEQWPAAITRIVEEGITGRHKEKFLISPYVGDRHLVVHPYQNGKWYVVADYSERPSAFAAAALIALIGRMSRWAKDGLPALWNDPEWVEVADDKSSPDSSLLDSILPLFTHD